MNLSKILIVAIVLICISIFACKAPKSMEQPLNDGHYLIHLNEGYNQSDLRELLGRNADRILPSSKTEELYLVHMVGDKAAVSELFDMLSSHQAIKSIESSDDKVDPATNGTNVDMKKTQRLGDM